MIEQIFEIIKARPEPDSHADSYRHQGEDGTKSIAKRCHHRLLINLFSYLSKQQQLFKL